MARKLDDGKAPEVLFNTINNTANGTLNIWNGSAATGDLVIGSSQTLLLNTTGTGAPDERKE